MSESKIGASHRQRRALVYIRQSSPYQVEHNRESTRRQYGLADRAHELGWHRDDIAVIDEDLGLSGDTAEGREGFARMTAEVALGQIGILLGLEVSRLARNNSDWYRLLDLCGLTDTLIADADGIYHPGLFNDRLLLGLKGTMSEAELHILRARLDGGIRNKAARGELYRGQPIGYVRGSEGDAEILLDPDEAVQGAIRAVFERFCRVRVRPSGVALVRDGEAGFSASIPSQRRRSLGATVLSHDPHGADQSGLCRRLRLRQDAAGTSCR